MMTTKIRPSQRLRQCGRSGQIWSWRACPPFLDRGGDTCNILIAALVTPTRNRRRSDPHRRRRGSSIWFSTSQRPDSIILGSLKELDGAHARTWRRPCPRSGSILANRNRSSPLMAGATHLLLDPGSFTASPPLSVVDSFLSARFDNGTPPAHSQFHDGVSALPNQIHHVHC